MNSDVPLPCNLYVGLKQATKAIQRGIAKKAYVANGVEPHLRNEFVKLCKKNHIPIDVVKSPHELGKMCHIDVKASVAVVTEEL